MAGRWRIGRPAMPSFLDIEHSRLGLIRIDAFDQALAELRATMN
jgi:hypothetical protein